MAQDAERSRRSRKRERVATLLLALFPVLVGIGFFAPGWVRVLALAEPAEPGVRQIVVDRVGPWGHRPLVPRDFAAGFVPELLDLDQLFLAEEFEIDRTGRQLAGISAFERSYGDSIAIEGAVLPALDVVFRDALMQRDTPDILAANDPEMMNLALCGVLHATNCVRDDDTGSGYIISVPIPEPGTAGLLGLGLLALAAYRRR